MQDRKETINQGNIKIYLMGNMEFKSEFSLALQEKFNVKYGEKSIPFNGYLFSIDWMDRPEAWQNCLTYTQDADCFILGNDEIIHPALSAKPKFLFARYDAKNTDINILFNQLIVKKETEKKAGLIINSGLDNNSELNCFPKEIKSIIACTLFAVANKDLLQSSVNETSAKTPQAN